MKNNTHSVVPERAETDPIHQPSQGDGQTDFDQLRDRFKTELLQRIPVAEIRLSYHSDVSREDRIKLTDSQKSYTLLKLLWDQDTLELQEQFKVLYLNRKNEVIGLYHHAAGQMDAVSVDPRLVIVAALKSGARAMVLAHNHPSGCAKPSLEDFKLTKRLQEAAKLLNLVVIDHLVITPDEHYSFADHGHIIRE